MNQVTDKYSNKNWVSGGWKAERKNLFKTYYNVSYI